MDCFQTKERYFSGRTLIRICDHKELVEYGALIYFAYRGQNSGNSIVELYSRNFLNSFLEGIIDATTRLETAENASSKFCVYVSSSLLLPLETMLSDTAVIVHSDNNRYKTSS